MTKKEKKNNNNDLAVVCQDEDLTSNLPSTLGSRKKSHVLGRTKTMKLDEDMSICTDESRARPREELLSLQQRREMRRPSSSISNYNSVSCSTSRIHKREKSLNNIGGTSRNKLQTIKEFGKTCIETTSQLRSSMNYAQISGL